MNILICFIGLVRTITKTIDNLKKQFFNDKDTFIVIFVTWESENTDDFVNCFPNASIFKLQDIYIDNNIHFDQWCQNTVMHHSWINTYGSNKQALFNYYRQIYLWDKAADILETYNNIDIIIRSRTDVLVLNECVQNYYNKVTNSTIFFSNEPRHSIVDNVGCPDYIFLGIPKNVIKLLKIIHYVNYLYNKYNVPIQSETTIHFFLLDNFLEKIYMNNSIEVIRNP